MPFCDDTVSFGYISSLFTTQFPCTKTATCCKYFKIAAVSWSGDNIDLNCVKDITLAITKIYY